MGIFDKKEVVEETVVDEAVVDETVVDETVTRDTGAAFPDGTKITETVTVEETEELEIEVKAPINPNPLVFIEESVTIYPNGKPTVVAAGEQRMSEAKITLLEQCGKQVKRI